MFEQIVQRHKLTKTVILQETTEHRRIGGWGNDKLLSITMTIYNDNDRTIYMYKGNTRKARNGGVGGPLERVRIPLNQ
jgi:hypothetical protein